MKRKKDIINYLKGNITVEDMVQWEDRAFLDPALRAEINDVKLTVFISDKIDYCDSFILTEEEKHFFWEKMLQDPAFRDKASVLFDNLQAGRKNSEEMTFEGFIKRLEQEEHKPEGSSGHRAMQALKSEEERQEMLLSALSERLSALKKGLDDGEAVRTGHPGKHTPGRVVTLRVRRWAVAASIALLAGIGGYWLFEHNTAGTPTDYFAAYYEPYELKPNKIDNYEAYTDAFKSYSEGDYEQAQQKLSEVITENNNYLTALFYLGVSSIETNEIDMAIASLKKVSASNSIHFADAKWYLALCYVKTGEPKRAKTHLEDIVALGNTKYREPAGKLLKDLS